MRGISRLIVLGASNLARGLPSVVSASRAAWGPEVHVLAALGYGRSYGAPSRILVRTLPSILESGLWRVLASLPDVPTRAVISDVGNDIIYGFSAEQTLAWVEETIDRLQRVTRDIVLTDLPIVTVQRLSRPRYLLLRSVLAPNCNLSLTQVLERGRAVNAGLAKLAPARGVRFFRLDPAWYGFDPIHIRRSHAPSAWQQILDVPGVSNGAGSTMLEGVRLSFMAPERKWICGIERFTPQSGVRLPAGGTLWLY